MRRAPLLRDAGRIAALACLLAPAAHAATPRAIAGKAAGEIRSFATVTVPAGATLERLATPPKPRLEHATPRTLGDPWIVLMSEDFEGGFPEDNGWDIRINTARPYSWNDENDNPHSGSWSGWCAGAAYNGASDLDAGSANYPNDLNAWMIWGPFDLTAAEDAVVTFWYNNVSETSHDYFSWYASKDGTNYSGLRASGNSNGWQSTTFDLKNVFSIGDLRGQRQVWIAFNFTSDGSTNFKGAFVDDVVLQVQANPPPFAIHSLVSTATQGAAIPITATITDDGPTISAQVHWRLGGETAFSQAGLARAGDQFTGQIPGSAVTARGLEYYLSATDGQGTSFVPAGGPDGPRPVDVNVTSLANGANQPSGGAQNSYRMISIPYDADDRNALSILGDDLGGAYDSTRWRLFRYEGNAYHEYPDSRAATLDPGKAYWLIVRDAGRRVDVGPGVSTALDDSFYVTLAPGWNDVANPFAFNVPWSIVRAARGSIDGPYLYEGSWRAPATVTTLEPWKGYAIRNLTGSSITMAIPPSTSATPLAPVHAEREPGWYARLEARCGEALDDDNLVGWAGDATDGKDATDWSEPPPVGDFVALSFPSADGADAWTADVRSVPLEGQRWPVRVETRVAAAPVRLSWSGFESLPAGLEAALLDPVEGVAIDPRRETSYVYENAARRDLVLLAGTPAYVRSAVQAVTVPAAFALAPASPNPSRGPCTLRFQLPRAAHVALRIHDPLGRLVRTLADGALEAGHHRVSWDGRDAAGRRLPDGVYFVRLATDGFAATRKLVLAR